MDANNIKQLQELCSNPDNLEVTRHTLLRFQERGILFSDVLSAIESGEIIEDYPEDYPFPSCLLYGLSKSEKPLHVVCGVGKGRLWIITAYFPSDDKWENDYRKRKVVK